MIRTKSRGVALRTRVHPPAVPVSRPLHQRLLTPLLLIAMAGLDRLARRAADRSSTPTTPSVSATVEFHVPDGAVDGALYVDGRFVGWLPGVQRL